MKRLETSISPNYVPDWKMPQAVREIVQNTLDEKGEIEYDGECGKITLTTHSGRIPREMLALGNSGKRGDDSKIGRHGDGLKTALAVILREGKGIAIHNGGLEWKPAIGKNTSLGCECVVIEETDDGEETDDVTIEIWDVSDEIDVICGNSLQLQEIVFGLEKRYDETKYGDLLYNEELIGNVYVNGLFIQHDPYLKYGFDFDARYVTLDRDRKAVNYYELRKMVSTVVIATGNVDTIVSVLYDDDAMEHDSIDYLDHADKDTKDGIVQDYCDNRIGKKTKIAFDPEQRITPSNVVCVSEKAIDFFRDNPSVARSEFVYVQEKESSIRAFVNDASDDQSRRKSAHIREIEEKMAVWNWKKKERSSQLEAFNCSEYKKCLAVINRMRDLGASKEDLAYLERNMLDTKNTSRFTDILEEIDPETVTDGDYRREDLKNVVCGVEDDG